MRLFHLNWILFSLIFAISCNDDSGVSPVNIPDNNSNNSTTNSSTNNSSNNATQNNPTNNASTNNVDPNNSTPTLSRVQMLALAQPYSKLVVELDYVEGFAPNDIDARYASYMANLVDKPDGIEVVRDQSLVSPGAEHVWTFEELKTLMTNNLTLELEPNEVRIHVIFVNGGYEKDSAEGSTLGLAWLNNIVMFEETIRAGCQRPILQGKLCEFTELAILLHETGHVLGLVDNGAPLTSEHLDTEHGHHCTNPDCIMYWEYEGSKLIDALRSKLDTSDEAVIEFDSACLMDLAAIE